MLKSILGRTLLLLTPDENTGGESSTPPDENGQESSPEQQAGEEEKVEGAEETPPGEEGVVPPIEEQSGEEAESGEKPEEKTVEAESTEPVLLDKPEDAKLSFQQHPRFQELIKEKQAATKEVEALRPQAARVAALDGFLQQNNIQPQQLNRALEYLRLANSDPDKAFDLLKPDYEKLAALRGERLAPDLQEKVASGVLGAEEAKELSRLRAQQAYQQERAGMTGQTQAARVVQEGDVALNQWAQSKSATDADLRAGSILWNYLDNAIKVARQQNLSASPAEVVKIAEAKYAEAKTAFKALQPKPVAVKGKLKSSQSRVGAAPVIKTGADVVRALMAGQRPHQMRYS
jgi:hypothetical protein